MKNNTGLLISLLIGAAAGAVIAVFFASDEGQELIDDAKDMYGKAEKEIRDAVANLEDKLQQGKELATSLEKQSGKLFKKFTS